MVTKAGLTVTVNHTEEEQKCGFHQLQFSGVFPLPHIQYFKQLPGDSIIADYVFNIYHEFNILLGIMKAFVIVIAICHHGDHKVGILVWEWRWCTMCTREPDDWGNNDIFKPLRDCLSYQALYTSRFRLIRLIIIDWADLVDPNYRWKCQKKKRKHNVRNHAPATMRECACVRACVCTWPVFFTLDTLKYGNVIDYVLFICSSLT